MTREERLTAKITGFIITSVVKTLLVLGLFFAAQRVSVSLSETSLCVIFFITGMVFMCLSNFIDNTRNPAEKTAEAGNETGEE